MMILGTGDQEELTDLENADKDLEKKKILYFQNWQFKLNLKIKDL